MDNSEIFEVGNFGALHRTQACFHRFRCIMELLASELVARQIALTSKRAFDLPNPFIFYLSTVSNLLML